MKKSNWPSFPSKKKNLQNMKLLLSDESVIEIVSLTRKYLGIPEHGFKQPDQKNEFEEWYDGLIKQCNKINDSSSFNKQLIAIDKKFHDKEISKSEYRNQQYDLFLEIPINYLRHQVQEIIEKYSVPGNYEYFIERYIYWGKVEAPIANFSVNPIELKPGQKMRDVRSVPITVYSKLTDTDLRDLKLEVNKIFGKDRIPFIQQLKADKDLDKELVIEQSYRNRTVMDEVEHEEYTLTAEEVAENDLGDSKKKGEIYKIIQNLKRVRKSRFSKE